MTASTAVTAASATVGTATATVSAAADLPLVVNLIIDDIPYGQTYAAKHNNCRDYRCHDLIPFLSVVCTDTEALFIFSLILLYLIFSVCTSPG